MACFLKQNTAVNIALGPFVDSTDGVTAETGLTISQADVRIKKNGGDWAQKADTNAATHEENGWYEVPLGADDTDTLGVLIVAVTESGTLPVWREFMVVPANVYDSLVADSDTLQADVTQIAGSNVNTSTAQLGVNVVTAGGTAWASGAITADVIANDAIDAATFAADVDAEILSYIVDDATRIDASALNTATGTSIPAILEDTGTTLDGKLDTIDSNVDAILADTGTDGVVVASGSKTGYSLAADQSGVTIGTVNALGTQAKADVNAEMDTALSDYDPPTKAELDAGLGGLNDLDAAGIRAAVGLASANLDDQLGAIDDFLDTEIAAILEDTGTTLDDLVDDLEGRLTADLATALQAHALGLGRGVVDDGSTTTTVVFKSVNGSTPSSTDDFYNGRHIVFTSGALALQATSINDYDGTTKTATVSALTGTPAENATFIIV